LERKWTARATSFNVKLRSLPRTVARPASSAMSSAAASSSTAAARRMRSPRARAPSSVAAPPIGVPRLAQVPPPYGPIAVSPESTVTSSTPTPISSAMIWASASGMPCPWLVTPTSAVTAPEGSSRSVAPSCPEIGAPPMP
jgi:hypothetical protein